jgi:type IV fimbrial biogenesis protein FimT
MRARGFTLAELLVVLAISAMLLAMAAPGLARQRGAAALRTASSQTLAALQLARRIALERGQDITVCPSPDGVICGLGAAQWLLFANAPGGTDKRRDADDELLRQWQLPAGVSVSGTRGYAAFQPHPGAATTVTFRFCDAAAPRAGIAIVVSQTGRPRVERAVSAAACTGP